MSAGTPSSWQVRDALPTDLDDIMLLECAIFPTDAWSTESMRAELVSEHGRYLVACPDDAPERIDAYAGLLAPLGSPDADIQTIAVAPSARRHGLGRDLITRLCDEAMRRGANTIFLEVRVDNLGAQALYRSLGFEDIAVRPHYYQPDDVDALVMRRSLRTVKDPS